MPERQRILRGLITILLLILLSIGIYYRFAWVNWNQDANLHPDEYGLTNTLTQLSMPHTLGDYFNTRISPLSPYQKYDEAGQAVMDGPDNRLRWGQWPMILLRGAAEITGETGYNELRLMGRRFSALIDSLSVLLIFLIGRRLYGPITGLLGAALSALAVMQIQQSHFMTVDNFSVFFATLAMFAAVGISRNPPVIRRAQAGATHAFYQFDWRALGWHLLFGISFGMALTSKINLLPLGGMLLIAAFISIADLKLRYSTDLARIAGAAVLFMLVAGVAALITFRVTQPMSFRAETGDTTFLTLRPNPDWVESMKVASQESNGIGGGPPSEQWADRPAIIFPLMNMVVWGMGVPLGIAAWAGFAGAVWQMVRRRKNNGGGINWRSHLLPVVWTGGYFFFMATRWVKSVRYFLPVYPFLCLLAAWGLVTLMIWARSSQQKGRLSIRTVLAALAVTIVTGFTLVWSTAFVDAIYAQDHTRVQATKWIFANIPAPFHIQTVQNGTAAYIPIGAPDGLQINRAARYQQSFTVPSEAQLSTITLPHVLNRSSAPVELALRVSIYPDGANMIDEATLQVPPSTAQRGVEAQGSFHGAALHPGVTYYLTASIPADGFVWVYRNVLANEDWDEGLPFPFAGYDPFGQFYKGVTMQVRWIDDENKRSMYYQNLEQVDYVILPSQRAIWSACRLPRMYPMTLEYYRALFDGRLGFTQVAAFQSPLKLGPLWISDVGGTASWNRLPPIPRFNFNFFAAEEAFSVYDHPPVRIFKKNANYSLEKVKAILSPFDMSRVVNQAPVDTKVVPIQ